MANKLQGMIEEIRADAERTDVLDTLLGMLEAKQAELGAGATDEEAEKAVEECVKEQLAHLLGELGGDGDDDDDDDEIVVDKKYMEEMTNIVKEFFADEEWHYSERTPRPDVVIYELGFTLKGISLRMRVHVEDDPKVCRIDAILPITADETYDYVLCKAMAKENYPRRFGALQYDERDGEMSYRYSFPIGHGLHKDDLRRVFFAVASSAAGSFKTIQKYCVGKFKQKEISEILEKVSALVNDLNEE